MIQTVKNHYLNQLKTINICKHSTGGDTKLNKIWLPPIRGSTATRKKRHTVKNTVCANCGKCYTVLEVQVKWGQKNQQNTRKNRQLRWPNYGLESWGKGEYAEGKRKHFLLKGKAKAKEKTWKTIVESFLRTANTPKHLSGKGCEARIFFRDRHIT